MVRRRGRERELEAFSNCGANCSVDISTVSAETRDFIKNKVLELTPYDLQLEYGDWTYGCRTPLLTPSSAFS